MSWYSDDGASDGEGDGPVVMSVNVGRAGFVMYVHGSSIS
jgi:hypothetical protein